LYKKCKMKKYAEEVRTTRKTRRERENEIDNTED
jgi:hypothetical protein